MHILFVDDELDYLKVYIEDIKLAASDNEQKEPSIKQFDSLDKAYRYVKEFGSNIDLIILDIMMPGGKNFHNKEKDPMGLKSGFYFYRAERSNYPKIKINIFTNVTSEDIEENIRADDWAEIYYKDQLLPFELSDKIIEMSNKYQLI